MALQPEELFGTENVQRPNLRAFPYQDGISRGTLKQFGADTELANLTPLFYDDTTDKWDVWVGQSNEVNTITANATAATAGTFTLTVDGVVSAAIDFDATAAEVQAALEAMSNIAPGDVTAVQTAGMDLGDNNAVVTLTWGGEFAGQDVAISIQTGGLTGNAHALATTTAGGSDASDGSDIDGFLWAPDEPHTALLAGETIIQVFQRGVIHADDVPVPSGESRADLNEALKNSSLREKGIVVQGIVNHH